MFQFHSSTQPDLIDKLCHRHHAEAGSSGLRIAIVAGEISGDKLGAGLMSALKKRIRGIQFEGIGGDDMLAQGLKSFYPMERLSVMGIGAILRRLHELLKLRKYLNHYWGAENPPDLFIGIDAPVFNTGLELKLKKQSIKTLHYVSPSVWAWRPGRIKKIKLAVDHMLTLFPFEMAIYRQYQIQVTCVGHPMAEDIPLRVEQQLYREKLSLAKKETFIAILPGSRSSELKYLAPLFLQVAQKLYTKNPQLKFISAMANDKCDRIFRTQLQRYPDLPLTLFQRQSREVMAAADVILISSGTATLEAALLKRPMVVSYKVAPLSYRIFHYLSVLKYYALPNLLSGREIVPEFLQYDATSEKIVPAMEKFLNAKEAEKRQLVKEFSALHQSLRQGGSAKAADIVCQMLNYQC